MKEAFFFFILIAVLLTQPTKKQKTIESKKNICFLFLFYLKLSLFLFFFLKSFTTRLKKTTWWFVKTSKKKQKRKENCNFSSFFGKYFQLYHSIFFCFLDFLTWDLWQLSPFLFTCENMKERKLLLQLLNQKIMPSNDCFQQVLI